MRVLGVDPGLTRCGLGVVDSRPGRRVVLVAVGVARSPVSDDVASRLALVGDQVETWLDEHEPDAVAVERVFAQHNVRTVMGTAQVSGVVMAAAARRGIPVALHTPSEVKASVTGSGRAGKPQVQQMVARILGLAELPTPADAADALALAICHLWRPVAAGTTSPVRAGTGAGGAAGATSGATPAQLAWARAEAAARLR
ncbi:MULTISPECIES: crossover junction endodeoxyribonuclease RuvC [unclassified Actinotalea]|uniref:crossover junction endodeoxyribonuclease RuvC n=1 Tax=unclassified Actinotalea TaxID=2638618 RepID=UPI0015F5A782|nr:MULTISPECIES: crossover junction endodeoxyribonuclease RuvC [unclassified Actinotalea]